MHFTESQEALFLLMKWVLPLFVYDGSSTYPAGYSFSNNRYVETAVGKITQSTIVYIFLKPTGKSVNIGIREIVQLEFIQPISQITQFSISKHTPTVITTESHNGEQKRNMLIVLT